MYLACSITGRSLRPSPSFILLFYSVSHFSCFLSVIKLHLFSLAGSPRQTPLFVNSTPHPLIQTPILYILSPKSHSRFTLSISHPTFQTPKSHLHQLLTLASYSELVSPQSVNYLPRHPTLSAPVTFPSPSSTLHPVIGRG